MSIILPVYELQEIRPGSFMMGALPDDPQANFFEQARHNVELTKKIYVGQNLVSQELWKAVMGSNPSQFKGEDHPVDSISWFDAIAFCNRLSELQDLETVYREEDEKIICDWDAVGYRLLTEAEWEYCARGGDTHLFAGSENADEVAWYRHNTGRTSQPIGQKNPNGYGLQDMSGNLEEWVWDGYWEMEYHDRLKSGQTIVDPRGPEERPLRITRGGSWFSPPQFIRTSVRYHNEPDCRLNIIGLRVALANFE